jgi:hypothetical protein
LLIPAVSAVNASKLLTNGLDDISGINNLT